MWAAGVSLPTEVAAPSRALARDIRKHIVVVDDDTLTLSLVERTLRDYRLSIVRNGGEALEILSTSDPVNLLLTDYLMPGMNGEDLVKRARVLRPELAVLIMTGYANEVAAADPVWWASERHLVKPFGLEALRAAVESLIG